MPYLRRYSCTALLKELDWRLTTSWKSFSAVLTSWAAGWPLLRSRMIGSNGDGGGMIGRFEEDLAGI